MFDIPFPISLFISLKKIKEPTQSRRPDQDKTSAFISLYCIFKSIQVALSGFL